MRMHMALARARGKIIGENGMADVEVARTGAVLELTLNRPAKKNALTNTMYRALSVALHEADREQAIGAVVIAGAGGVFSAGNDIGDFVAAVAGGGALCGLAGAYLSVAYTPLWVEGMVAGKGWIALALTTFATWRPARVLLGAYLFGGVTMLQFYLQREGVQVPSQFLTMMPYLATILVLVLISRNANWIRINMPASIGKPFFPGG
jgi:hypothetical protein